MNQDFIITDIVSVIFIGKNEYLEKKSSFDSFLRHNELIYHFSGKSLVTFNDKETICEKDILRYLPKGENNKYTVLREEAGECIDVFFNTNVPISKEYFSKKIHNNNKISSLFQKIFSIWVAKNEGYYFECISILYKIFAELQKENYIPETQYRTIKPAIDYIGTYFLSKKISVTLLAEKCQISESYLKKLFVKKFGITPVKYIISLKINYACDLLRSELYSVAQVADMCGYNDTAFFSRQFKNYVGVSPSTFLEKYQSSK